MAKKTQQPPGTERHRDEQRDDATPRYGGRMWSIADERGGKRFGHARPERADPKPPPHDEVEASGERAGMHRGDKPRKKDPRREK